VTRLLARSVEYCHDRAPTCCRVPFYIVKMARLLAWLLLARARGFRPVPARAAPRTGVVQHGIPKMFRWLTDQYPSIMERMADGLPAQQKQSDVDDLYLDMNGIIHPLTHGNDPEIGEANIRDQMVRIFAFTDKICKIVAPRRTIVLAVDGVAPRAKMNQQRSRRFRSAKEREELRVELVAAGRDLPSDARAFDSNCITPGTRFMSTLSDAFEKWLAHKQAKDPFYANLEVVFSGPDIAGEGEHKVMDFIRARQKTEPRGTAKHCFYGLDADLIMLGLVTHEPKFLLLREKMSVRHARKGKKPKDPLEYTRYDFELLEVGLLRDMLRLQFEEDGDVEPLVDDFVCLCMLVGNDFLPNIPHLEIADGSLDLMMSCYKELRPTLGGFVSRKEQIHAPRLELIMRSLAAFEAQHFERRGLAEGNLSYQNAEEYKDAYYLSKFGIRPGDLAARRKVVGDYVLGLHWCLRYYHLGCKSWDWFYPHLYAPLASDIVDLADLQLEFPSSNSKPVPPLVQLMSVLPAQSSRLLPEPYAALMTSPESPLLDSYPADFAVDQNGKAQPWEAVVLIPFIDEALMAQTLASVDHARELSPAERRGNRARAQPWTSAGASK
jgi:5'-3' exonuclease